MKEYELGIVFVATLEEEKIDQEIAKITTLLEKEKCEITRVDKWGIKKLAYPIKKQENGFYIFIYFNGTSTIVPELERVNKINDLVLRQMIVKTD